jgi:hypothetical protein
MAKLKTYNPNLTISQQQRNNHADPSYTIDRKGVAGDNLIESTPNYIKATREKVIKGANNNYIVFGTDRPGEKGSGYGDTTQAGTIDIVVGRISKVRKHSILNDQSVDYQKLYCDPNLSADASRIYISQKTDADLNFGLADGNVGDSRARGAIILKSDAVRIIGREGIKLVTKTGKFNSHGDRIRSVPAIDIIAGNFETGKEPIVKGKVLRNTLKDIIERVNEVNSVLDQFVTYQLEFNSAVQDHDHPDFFAMFLGGLNGGKCPFSPELLAAGIKATATQQVAKHDGVMNKIKLGLSEMNNTGVFGSKEPSSPRVSVS